MTQPQSDAPFDLDGSIRTLRDIAARRKTRPLSSAEVEHVQRIHAHMIMRGHSPRSLGVSMRQLGLNPRARQTAPENRGAL